MGRLFVCLLLLAAGVAAAQGSARPDPADTKSPTAHRPYESATKDYRPYVDPPVERWRESNEEAGRLGGHAGHVPRKEEAKKQPARGHGEHK